MGLRVAAGTWGLFSVVMWAVLLEELLSDARPERLFLAAALGAANGMAWLPPLVAAIPHRRRHRWLLRRLPRAPGGVRPLRDSLEFLPTGMALVVVAILGGWLPMRHRRSLT